MKARKIKEYARRERRALRGIIKTAPAVTGLGIYDRDRDRSEAALALEWVNSLPDIKVKHYGKRNIRL